MSNNLQNVISPNYSKPLVDKDKLLGMTYNEKLIYLDNLRIYYPKMMETLNMIQECQDSINQSARPTCMSISGPSGSGKTTFHYIHSLKYPTIKTSEGTEIPVLYSRIPCPARIGSLAPKILYDMKDPFWSKHAVISQHTQRLYDLIKSCKVKIIFFDEVQHLVDRNSEILIRDSSDWFKELIDETKVPIVFLGLPESRRIFLENVQLKNRVSLREEVGPFTYKDIIFRKLLSLFDKSLPLKCESGLAESDLSKRIFLATSGLMKHMRDLIVEGTRIALKSNSSCITMPMMARAYDKILVGNFEENPFLPAFELDKAIEKSL